MKKTSNRRVIILSDLNSGYFEQAVFYIKANATSREDILINEANSIVNEFSRKYAVKKNSPKSKKKYAAYRICAAILAFFALYFTLYCIFQ